MYVHVFMCTCVVQIEIYCDVSVCACDVIEAHCRIINIRQDKLRSNWMTSSYKGPDIQPNGSQ